MSEAIDRPGRRPVRAAGLQSKLSIMHLFRSAHASGETKRVALSEGRSERGPSSSGVRAGIDEATLREHLRLDLQVLLSTVSLDSVVPLDDEPQVRKSIVNFGLTDLSPYSQGALASEPVIQSVRESLLRYEPRLLPESLDVRVVPGEGHADRCIRLQITAELLSDPIEFSLEVEAEVDAGAGKLNLSRVALQT